LNTTFLPATERFAAANKMAASQKLLSSGHGDNGSGFAGILASQAPIQPPQQQAYPSSSAGTAAKQTQPGGSTHTSPATQDSGTASSHTHDRAQTPPASTHQTSGTQQPTVSPASDHGKAAYRHVLAQHGQADTQAEHTATKRFLPAEFQKILAALPSSDKKGDFRLAALANKSKQTQMIERDHLANTSNRSHTDTPRIDKNTSPGTEARNQALASDQRLSHQTSGRTKARNIKLGHGIAAEQHASRVSAKSSLSGARAGKMPFQTTLDKSATTLHASEDLRTGGTLTRPDHQALEPGRLTASTAQHAQAGHLVAPFADMASDASLKTATLDRPFGSPQWANNLSQQFSSMVRHTGSGNHTAELRLDPPHLGPLRITINLNDSVVQAVFSSAHANVRSAVEQALPQLQQQLEQEGLSLGQTSVGEHSQGSQQSDHPDQAQSGGAATLVADQPDSDNTHTMTASASAVTHRPAADALVDTFA